jgi:hypothetical protein
MTKEMKSQKEQLKELRSQKKFAYEEASIYTVLLDLVEGNGLDTVFMTLHNLATDIDQREELEAKFERSKKWQWNQKETPSCIHDFSHVTLSGDTYCWKCGAIK